jgi:hypothetical protein
MMNPIYGLFIDIARDVFFILVGVIITLWCENLGSPRLSMKTGKTAAEVKANRNRTRFLHIHVANNPIKVPFIPRQTASSVHGTISFIKNPNGKQIGKSMDIRWDGAPEPVNYQMAEGKLLPVKNPDPRLMRVSKFMDIPPDETETMTIAVRMYNERMAYGWTSESYSLDWRHEDFALPLGEYTARIKLIAGNYSIEDEFHFANLEDFESFDFID